MITRLTKILALCTIVALPTYLIRFHVGPIPTTLLEILILLTVGLWIIEKIKKRGTAAPELPLRPTYYVLVSVFLLAATISIFIPADLKSALGIWRAYFVEPILFFFVLFDLLRRDQISRHHIIKALSIPALLLSLYAIVQRFTGWGIPAAWILERRVTSVFPYPNALGLFLAPLVPLFLGQLSKKNFLRTTYYTLIASLSLIAILFAHSTGAMVGIVAAIAIMSTIYFIQMKRWRWLFIVYLLFIFSGLGILSRPNFRQELLLQDRSGYVHKTQWIEAIDMLTDTSNTHGVLKPLLGVGLSGYQNILKYYHKVHIEIFQYPHQLYLTFWSETGLLGLASFLGLVIYFFVHGRKNLPVVAAMIVILIHGLVDIPYFKNDLAILFWIVYAVGIL